MLSATYDLRDAYFAARRYDEFSMAIIDNLGENILHSIFTREDVNNEFAEGWFSEFRSRYIPLKAKLETFNYLTHDAEIFLPGKLNQIKRNINHICDSIVNSFEELVSLARNPQSRRQFSIHDIQKLIDELLLIPDAENRYTEEFLHEINELTSILQPYIFTKYKGSRP